MAAPGDWTPPAGRFIARLNPADLMTLTALALCVGSLLLVSSGRIYLGMAVLLLAMLFDAFDGIVARKYGWEGPFGRYLDGFVDAFNYLALPSVILWVCGLQGPVHGVVLFVFTAAGLVRLSVFNQIGNIRVCGGLSYLGLPVFWSHFLVAALVGFRGLFPPAAWPFVVDACLLLMSVGFVVNRPFWKPKSQLLIVGVIAAMAAFFTWKGL